MGLNNLTKDVNLLNTSICLEVYLTKRFNCPETKEQNFPVDTWFDIRMSNLNRLVIAHLNIDLVINKFDLSNLTNSINVLEENETLHIEEIGILIVLAE